MFKKRPAPSLAAVALLAMSGALHALPPPKTPEEARAELKAVLMNVGDPALTERVLAWSQGDAALMSAARIKLLRGALLDEYWIWREPEPPSPPPTPPVNRERPPRPRQESAGAPPPIPVDTSETLSGSTAFMRPLPAVRRDPSVDFDTTNRSREEARRRRQAERLAARRGGAS